ncbi:hypothetical protein H5410_011952 [Solanum commersonii]|uniref:NAC domain-containing protein n=1 Tax=Solanum commersonii TaxID=4109 RepID=A0A9J6AQ75_SOLCO|nr:hypothetical protein H5410_011952 [Solanum commersonii]
MIDEPLLEQHQYMQLVDLYADKESWEILEGTNTNAGCFITPLEKEKPHHKRFKRIVGEGTWKIQDPAKKVFDEKEDDNIEVDIGVDFLAALEDECMNSEENE